MCVVLSLFGRISWLYTDSEQPQDLKLGPDYCYQPGLVSHHQVRLQKALNSTWLKFAAAPALQQHVPAEPPCF